MINYILRRLVVSALLLLVVSMVTFAIFFLIPKAAGSDPAELYVGKSATPHDVEATRIKLGLDKPVPVQYARFVKGLFVGRDFGWRLFAAKFRVADFAAGAGDPGAEAQ